MKKNNLIIQISTLGPLGYLIAPGTIGTITTLPLVYLLSFINPFINILIIIALFFATLFIVRYASLFFKESDPSQIILDEVIGCLISFWALPINVKSLLLGIIIFRILDIYKPFGIKKLENLKNGYGIILDDVVAGIVTNLILHFFL